MSHLLPLPASSDAADIDVVMTLVHLLMLGLFVGWGLYLTWVLVRYRQSRQPQANPDGARGRFALWTEVSIVAAEVVLLVVFALPVWLEHTAAQPADPAAVTVRLVAQQFVWNVHYPGADGRFGTTSPALMSAENPLGLDRQSPFGRDDVTSVGELHVPINRQVIVQLSSTDVIHSFGVPAMRVKRDAVPGVVAPVWFTPTLAGQFDIACSQLCGLAHFRMKGRLIVESASAFQKFLADEAAAQRSGR